MKRNRYAHAILDRVREGERVGEDEIRAALMATGDLGDGEPIRILRPVGSWERSSNDQLLRPAEPFDGLAA